MFESSYTVKYDNFFVIREAYKAKSHDLYSGIDGWLKVEILCLSHSLGC